MSFRPCDVCGVSTLGYGPQGLCMECVGTAITIELPRKQMREPAAQFELIEDTELVQLREIAAAWATLPVEVRDVALAEIRNKQEEAVQ